MMVSDLGLMAYRDAWRRQEAVHAQVAEGAEETILLVEHPPVITHGRRGAIERHMLADEAQLAKLGVEVVQSDRGGDITFHGPGQLVAYPIIRLAEHQLSVGGYVHLLEAVVMQTLVKLGIDGAHTDPSAVGVWVNQFGRDAKICALGVRIRRGATMHGLALNVSTDLHYFDLIVPCGLTGRPVTSIRRVLGDKAPDMTQVRNVLTSVLIDMFQDCTAAGRAERL